MSKSSVKVAANALSGRRTRLAAKSPAFPQALRNIPQPPEELYVLGDPDVLQEGLAVVGARKATPYGLGCARRFAGIAAGRGITIISGGAFGCDAAAHKAALEMGAPTVVFLGGGCDQVYPAAHVDLFQQVIDAGGAVVSEHPWDFPPQPWTFRTRNRLIAGLARATLIVEAGLPSGTFSTADEAIAAGKEVLVVPGAITSARSRGANRLIYQGARPIVDDETFSDTLVELFGIMSAAPLRGAGAEAGRGVYDPLLEAISAQPASPEELISLARRFSGTTDPMQWLSAHLADLEACGLAVRRADGCYLAKVDR